MLTSIYSIGRVSGAWLMLAGWLACTVGYWVGIALLICGVGVSLYSRG